MRFAELKTHPFFNGLSFHDLMKKKIRPEYQLPLSEPCGCIQNGSREFKRLTAVDSDAPPVEEQFTGFSFIAEPPEPSDNVMLEPIVCDLPASDMPLGL
jgi:hypothetical protein